MFKLFTGKKSLLMLFTLIGFWAMAQKPTDFNALWKDICPQDECADTLQIQNFIARLPQKGQTVLVAKANEQLCKLHFQNGRFKTAQLAAYKALKQSISGKLHETTAKVYYLLALIDFAIDDVTRASVNAKKGLEAIEQLPSYKSLQAYWDLLEQQAVLEYNSNQNAAEFAREMQVCMAFYLERKDSLRYWNTFRNGLLAFDELYSKDSILRLCGDYFRYIYKNEDDTASWVVAHLTVGKVLQLNELFDSSNYHYSKAYNLQSHQGNQILNSVILEMMSEPMVMKGDYEEAYQKLFEFVNFRDSLFSLERTKEIESLRTQLQTEHIEWESERNLQALRIQKRNNIILAIVAFAIASIALFGWLYYRQKRELQQQEVEIAQQKVQHLIQQSGAMALEAMVRGQEEERKRMGRDLHDAVGSLLATVKLRLSLLAQEHQIDNEHFSLNLLDNAMSEVRRISHQLSRGQALNFNLLQAINQFKAAVDNLHGIELELQTFGLDSNPLPAGLELEVYRIVQELFSNSVKHSNARHISINFTRSPNHLNLTFEDDGKGFNPEEMSQGIGISNIRERIERLGANMHIDSKPGRGSTFIFDFNTFSLR